MKIGKLGKTLATHFIHCINSEMHLPVLISGSPGIGKTEIVKQAVETIGSKIDQTVNLRISHPVTRDPVDYGGHPVIVEGKAEHLAYGDLRFLQEVKEITIVLIDDVGQSKPSVQAALMQLVREREINGMKLSDAVHFVLCTNGANDKAGVTGILRPLMDRALCLEVEGDTEAFAAWLKVNHSDVPVLEAWVLHGADKHLNGEELDPDQIAGRIGAGYPTPRSITMMAEVFKAGHDMEVMTALGNATIGKACNRDLMSFAKVYRDVTRYPEVVKNPTGAKLPKGTDGMYAQITMLCQRGKRKDMAAVATYVKRIGGDFLAYFWSLIERSRPELCESKAYQEWRMTRNY